MCKEKENPLYEKFLQEIEECAEDHLGDWEMKLLKEWPEVLERLYKMEKKMNRLMIRKDWKGLLAMTPKWKEAHEWIRKQARKKYGQDIKCEVARRRVTLKDGKII